MVTWVDTFRSLFLGRWWWLPSMFFGPWWLSVLVWSLIVLALWLSLVTTLSNAAFLVALALAGAWVGAWTRRLHGWDCAVLVPRLSRHLFVLSLAIVGAFSLVFAAASMYAGNSLPALGPALLVGIGTVYGFVRIPERLATPMTVVLFYWLLGLLAVGALTYSREISHVALQVPALALALILPAFLKRTLEAPFVEQTSFAVQGQGLVVENWSISAVARQSCRLAFFGLALDTLVLLASGHSGLWLVERFGGAGFGYDGLFFASGMIIMFPMVVLTGNPYPVAWLMGTGGTRSRLAWTLLGRMVVGGALPLLAFFLAVETVQSLLSAGAPRFEFLLKIQILAFLAFVVAYAFRRRYPNRFLTNVPTFLVIVFWFTGPDLAYWLDFGTPILALLVVGSAMTAILVVGHGLARADYLL